MRSKSQKLELNFDSFTDIVTNVVGLMILILVVVVVNAGDMTVSLGTPVLRDPPAEARRVLFECRGDRIVQVDEEMLDAQILKVIKDRNAAAGTRIDVDDLPGLFEKQDIGDDYYRVRVKVDPSVRITNGSLSLVRAPVWIYMPRNPLQGETTARIAEPTSEYRQLLRGLSPQRHYLFFIVREDSFDAFRAARRLAQSQEFACGWYPRSSEESLQFSEGGGLGTKVQ